MTRRLLIALVAVSLGVAAAVAVSDAGARSARVTHKSTPRCKPVRHGARRPRHATCKPKPKPKPKPVAARKPTSTTTVIVGATPAGTTTTTTAPSAPPPAQTTTTASPPPPAALPSRLGVDEQEYSVYPTHDPVAAGSVEFNVSNFGQDDHDLTISRDGVQVAQLGVVHPGEQQTLVATLAPGTYKLYCSLYDHDQLGMHATLVVQ